MSQSNYIHKQLSHLSLSKIWYFKYLLRTFHIILCRKTWILDHISMLQEIYLFCTDSIRGFDHSINTRVDDGYHTSFYICDLFHHGFDLIYSVLLHTLHLLKNSIKVQRIKYHPLTWHVSRLHNEDMHIKLKLCDH